MPRLLLFFRFALLLALFLAVPAAHAQTILTGGHDYTVGGYTVHGPGAVIVPADTAYGPSATFNNNSFTGLTVDNNASLTINGGQFNNNRYSQGNSPSSIGLNLSSGTATINAGQFNGNYQAGFSAGANTGLTITGGQFNTNTHYGFTPYGAASVLISGGQFNHNDVGFEPSYDSNVIITGGQFFGNRIADIFSSNSTVDVYGNFQGVGTGQSLALPTGDGTFTGTLEYCAVPQTIHYINNTIIVLHDAPLQAVPVVPTGLTFDFPYVVAGQSVFATVTLSGSAPAGGLPLLLTINDMSAGTATIPEGQTTATIALTFPASYARAQVTVGATAHDFTAYCPVTVNSTDPTPVGFSPSSVVAGGPDFTLTVTGTSFTPTCVVQWNSMALATTYVSPTQLIAAVPAVLTANPAFNNVSVTDTALASTGSVPALPFTVASPVPSLSAISPATATAGIPDITLTLTGTGFTQTGSGMGGYPVPSSSVQWNGQRLSTTYVSPTQLTATVAASLLTAAGTEQVSVYNSPGYPIYSNSGGGTSNALPFTIVDGGQAVFAIDPSSAAVGGPGFTLTVTGTNFTAACAVQWAGASLSTTYISPTQLKATVPASYMTGSGIVVVRATDNSTGAVSASYASFSITSPIPTLSALNPASATAGSASLTLTVTGTGFSSNLYQSGSYVQWNNQQLTTTYVSPTQLTATVPTSCLADTGTAQVTVVKPTPGATGTPSNALPFTVMAAPDMVAPTTTASLSGTTGGNSWYRSTVQVTLSATDNIGGSGIGATTYTLDGGPQQAYSAPFTVTGNGTHTVQFWSVDKVGNTESAKTQSVKIDVLIPTTTASFSGQAGGSGWYHSNVQVTLSATDNAGGSGVASTTYSVAGAVGTNYATPTIVNVSGEGTHSVQFWSTDVAGNTEGSQVQSVKIDTTPPRTSVSVSGPTVTLTASDALSKVAGTYYTVDNGAQQTYSAPFTVTGGGTRSVTFWSIDVAGNIEAAKMQSVFAADTLAPTTTASLSGTAGSNGWYTSPVQITLSAADDTGGSGVANTFYTLDAGPQQTYSAPFAISTDGTHKLAFWSVDKAGNTETVNTQTVKIDAAPPTLTFGAPTPAANAAGWNHTSVDVPYTASDAMSGVLSTSPGSPVHFASEGPGQTQTVAVTDNAGNSAPFTTPAVNIDLTAPVTTASVSGTTVTLSAMDALSGVMTTVYSINGGAQQGYSGPFTVTGAGTHMVSYFSTDVAGNSESPQSATVSIAAPITVLSLSLSPTSVKGGAATSTGTITLSSPAPAGGVSVTQTSSDTSTATLASKLNIPAGATSAKFKITTYAVSANKSVIITSALNGSSQTATLMVTGTAPVTVSGLSLSPASVPGGSASTATVTLSAPAPTGGMQVALQSSDTASASVPASVTVAAGKTTVTFPVTSSPVTSRKSVTITATLGISSQSATLTVTPVALAITVVSLSLSPTSVKGGVATSTGTITLSGPAPSGGVSITQTSSDTSAATLAPKLNIAAGLTSAKFKITTYAVSANKTVTITSTLNGTSKTAFLTVTH